MCDENKNRKITVRWRFFFKTTEYEVFIYKKVILIRFKKYFWPILTEFASISHTRFQNDLNFISERISFSCFRSKISLFETSYFIKHSLFFIFETRFLTKITSIQQIMSFEPVYFFLTSRPLKNLNR